MMQSRWLTPVGMLVVALVVLASAAGDVGVGGSGKPLALTVWLVAYAAAGLVFLLDARHARWQVIALLAVLGAAAVALHAIDPGGPVVGLFLVPAFAPLRLPVRTAIAISAASAFAFNVVQLLENDNPVVFALVTDGGVAFFFLFGWLLRREAEQRTRLDTALTELEARRDAEAVAVALAERGRIAREMHDVLAHTLSGLSLQLGGVSLLARGSAAGDPELRAGIARAHGLAKEGLAEARRAIGALRGDALPGPEQLPGLVDEHRQGGGTVTLHVIGEPVPLAAEQKLAIYRTAQEGLSNIRKHAPRTTGTLILRWGADTVAIEVCNDLPARADQAAPGYGLTGLAERAHLLGGTFTAGPTDEQFRLTMRLPVNGADR